MREKVGSPMYMAPEMLINYKKKSRAGYGKEIDIWAAGIVLYMLVYGKSPFQDMNGKLFEEIKQGNYICGPPVSCDC